MKKLKKPFLFALSLLPIGAVAGYFTILYQLDFLDAASVDLAVSQMGSVEALIAVYVVQIAVYTLVCAFVGCILAEKLGLMKPLCFEKAPMVMTLAFCSVWITGLLEHGSRAFRKQTLQR